MKSGFVTGTLRHPRQLEAYLITKYPVTWARFSACVQAGACAEADSSACEGAAYAPYSAYKIPKYEQTTPDAPAVCVGESQAESYCRWIGGRLPTLDEWLMAARGEEPKRFAWGELPTSCDQHPLAPQLVAQLKERAAAETGTPADAAGCAEPSFDGSELHVGKHASGAAPSGMQDVLLMPAELLRADADTIFNACGGASKYCTVFGMTPAAIDSVAPVFKAPRTKNDPAQVSRVAHAYGFRCVVGAKNQEKP